MKTSFKLATCYTNVGFVFCPYLSPLAANFCAIETQFSHFDRTHDRDAFAMLPLLSKIDEPLYVGYILQIAHLINCKHLIG